jgi:RimJ/RimL family protein N-acetyltransferase
MALDSLLASKTTFLEPASVENIDLLIQWTLDPVAQGSYKRVPTLTSEQLRELFLGSSDRRYYLIQRAIDQKPLGRFYHRAWVFGGGGIDWELNIFIADPDERGKGYGTEVQKLASDHLLLQPETRTVFAYTLVANIAEQRALEKAGFVLEGFLPHSHYRVPPPAVQAKLYVKYKMG